MSLFSALSVGASGMAAQRARAELLVENLANAETTRTADGGPYRRKEPVFQSVLLGTTQDGAPVTGVAVAGIQSSDDPFITKYDPTHPDADPSGIVKYPNVNPVDEMVNLTEASRSFDANIAVVRAVRTMELSAQDLLRVQ